MIKLAAKNPVISNLCFLMLISLGIMSVFKMDRELFPIFSFDLITIGVAYPGASPAEVEADIVSKIEEAINNIPKIKRISSFSSEGYGSIIVELEEGANVQKAKDEINTEIDRITTFPREIEKPVVSEIAREEPMLFYALTGDLPQDVLREWAEKIKKELESLEGVSKVSLSGSAEYEYRIEISQSNLIKYNLTIDQIANQVRKESLDLPGGIVKSNDGEILLRGLNEKKERDLFLEIPIVSSNDGSLVKLKDIAKVSNGLSEDKISCKYFDDPAVILQIKRKSNTDGITISDNVKDHIEKTFSGLPKTMRMVPWMETTVHIKDRIDLLLRNGWQGFVLLFIVLWAFLNLRLSFWVAMGIPTSFGGALLLMYLSGQTLNMISLFALIMALGIIVDDAIVVGENIFSHLKEGKSAVQAAIDGAKEVAAPVLGSVATTIVAFVPMLLMTGVFGKFMRVIPYAMIAALIISLFECFFILPGHLVNADRKKEEGRLRKKINRLIELIIFDYYKPLFTWCLNYRYVFLVISFCVLGITMLVIKSNYVKFVLFPKIDQTIIDLSFQLEEGAPFEETNKIVEEIRNKTLLLNENLKDKTNGKNVITQLISSTGQSIGISSGRGSHLGMVILEILPSTERNIHSREVEEEWRNLIGTIPGVKKLAFGKAFNDGPSSKAIEINLHGDNLDLLQKASNEIKKELSKIEFVADINDNLEVGKRELRYRFKEDSYLLDIDFDLVARQLRNHFYGRESFRFSVNAQEIKVLVSLPKEERGSLQELNKQFFHDRNGNFIPFYEIFEIELDQGLSSIKHFNGQRSVLIDAEVEKGGDGKTILENFETQRLKKIMKNYPSLHYTFEGQSEQTKESFGSLFNAYLYVALPLIYFILATIFKSYLQPFLIMFIVPFGIIGAVIGHVLLNYDLSMFSMIGIVALSGIVINDSLVLVDFINKRVREGAVFKQAVVESGIKRFRAIILTSLTTVAGLLPLLFETSLQAQIIIPMAISISFGVIVATVLTLLFIPVLYYILDDFSSLFKGVVQ